MSRRYLWEYVISGDDAHVKWEQFFAECECERVACHKQIQGGGSSVSGDQPSTIWTWANKAKARRLKERLDAHFRGAGTIGLVTFDD